MSDPAKRSEMMVQSLVEEIGLDKDQRTQIKDIIDRAQNSAKPLQQELQETRKLIKTAVRAGKKDEEIDSLNQKLAATYTKLASLQSHAFADALKTLKDDQKEDADVLYDTLNMLTGSGGRGGFPGPGGPSGFGPPPGFGGPLEGGDRPPGGSNRPSPPPYSGKSN